jgi:hypothetical protein
MANNVLKDIADNLGVVGYDNTSLLIGIADYYGVNTAISTNLMGDILTAVGGNPAISNDYIQDIVIELGGPSTSLNWIEEWETITAVPPAPVNTVAPVISGTMVVGQTLTTTNGTWTNSPTSFTYKWYKGITAIVGATSSTYILVQADAGTTTAIKCEVTAINLGGSTAADSNTLTTVYDADAQAFITAAVITVLVQMTAINELTIGLKADSLWTSMKALYPFVGGTSNTHKFNLKDPRDLDAAFRLQFFGGVTHDSNGITGSVNGYADTKFTILGNLSATSQHLTTYSRTNSAGTFRDIGVQSAGNNVVAIISKWSDNNSYFFMGANYISAFNTSSTGLYITNKPSTLVSNAYKNGTLISSRATIDTLPLYPIYIMAWNITGTATDFSPRNQAFASIGDGLTGTDVTNLYNRVQAYQTTLGRQV